MKIEQLSWSQPETVQRETVSHLSQMGNINLTDYMMPAGKKDCWENCARIIFQQPDDVIVQYASSLFFWLQDPNWPGADIISARLKKLPKNILALLLKEALETAQNDEDWLDSLRSTFDIS